MKITLYSEKFDELKNNPLYRSGMAFKYSSDFRLDPNDDREVPDDILEYLAKRGAVFPFWDVIHWLQKINVNPLFLQRFSLVCLAAV